jgi:UrcA family protein
MKTQSSATYLIASAAIAGALAAGFATGPAFAQSASFETYSFKFPFTYRTSELASTESAEKLLLRLQREVRDHCGGTRKMPLEERALVTKCTNQTMRESIGKFGSATLAQAYETRTGG